ncbi:MAG: COP23 domain-containing protein [Thermosynechococcaceae cyanobacterium MS004]|nr:COP23 domain-containing protein [Thermosynechococcaceae cyanobacterium MS004]
MTPTVLSRSSFRLATLIALIAQAMLPWTTPTVQAETVPRKFFCGKSKNAPTTMAQTSRGPVPVIRWVSTLGEVYTPEVRCQIVSDKFQKFYDDGTLNFLTTGFENQHNVICAAQKEGGSCVGVLFTLKPNSDPERTLKRLLNIRDRSTDVALNEAAQKLYVNVNDFLETSPVATDSSSEGKAAQSPTPTRRPKNTVVPATPDSSKAESKSIW